MFWQSAILLFFGIIFLIWGVKAGHKPDNDTLTTLKGLAVVKGELDELKRELEQLRQEISFLRQEIDSTQDKSRIPEQSEQFFQGLDKLKEEVSKLKQEVETWKKEVSQAQVSQAADHFNETKRETASVSAPMSQKYRNILSLAEEGYSVREISDKLAIGQDAVSMVLNTYRRGQL